MADHVFRSACLFGGGGGMALGTQQARQRFREHAGAFELVGAYDFDAYACQVYEYLTGSPEAQLDATTVTPEDIRKLLGPEPPDCCWLSAPCKGSSKLLSSAKAETAKYVAMNDLSYRGVLTLLDAYPDDPIGYLAFENVPNITTRAKTMLAALRKLLRSRGYVLHDGFHEARHIGDLAQRRKRWFMIARHPSKVPVFLYKPPHKAGKVCGDVLGELPLPNDPAGGPMHRLSDTSMINLLRLWAIPAGGDWRDLIADGRPRRERFRRHHIEKWSEPSVTIGGSGSNGPCGIADPRNAAAVELERARPGFTSMDHVLSWDGTARTVTGATRPGTGAPSVADPRGLNLLDGATPTEEERRQWEREGIKTDGQVSWFNGKYHVTPWEKPTGTVIGAGAGNGGGYVADPRAPMGERYGFGGTLGVLGPDDVATPVTGRAGPTTGSFSYAAPIPPELRPQAGNSDMHWGKYVVVPWRGTSGTVTGASRVGSGAPSIADPRVDLARPNADGSFHEGAGPGRWGVLSPLEPATTVTRNARLGTGPFSIAAPAPQPVNLIPTESCYDAGYGVLSRGQPARTIAATSAVGCGAYAIADDVPRPVDLVPQGVIDNPERAARYGVLRSDQPSRTVTGTTRVGCGAFAIAAEIPQPVQLGLGCEPRADAYGVTPFDREVATVTGHFKVDNSRAAVADPRPAPPPYVVLSHEETQRIVDGEVAVPFAIVDPSHPGEPLAIVEDLKRPPFRWVETKGNGGKVTRKRETVALVLIAADGTWHRPLTTLELAVLQAFPARHRGKPLDFGGGTTAQREVIGNAVPPAVAKAMAEQMLTSLLVSRTVGFALGDAGSPVWVRNVRALESELRREGYVVVKGRKPMNFTTGELLDDGAPIWLRAKVKKKTAKRRTKTQAIPVRAQRSSFAEATLQ